jgi:hypothetical protein
LGHFPQKLRAVNLQSLDALLSLVVINFVPDLPDDESLQVIRNNTQAQQPVLQVEEIMELLDGCLRTTDFHVDNTCLQQNDVIAIITHC